jgi:hypothetical protein
MKKCHSDPESIRGKNLRNETLRPADTGFRVTGRTEFTPLDSCWSLYKAVPLQRNTAQYSWQYPDKSGLPDYPAGFLLTQE